MQKQCYVKRLRGLSKKKKPPLRAEEKDDQKTNKPHEDILISKIKIPRALNHVQQVIYTG